MLLRACLHRTCPGRPQRLHVHLWSDDLTPAATSPASSEIRLALQSEYVLVSYGIETASHWEQSLCFDPLYDPPVNGGGGGPMVRGKLAFAPRNNEN